MSKKKNAPGQLIYGINPVVELLKSKRRKLVSIYTTKPTPKAWIQIEKLLPKHVPIQYVNRSVLTKMTEDSDHQGVVAWVQDFPFRIKPFDSKKQPFILVLDGIQDTRNLGAILRSAYCAGVDGVIMSQRGAAPLNAVALKSSAGLAEHLEVMRVPTVTAALKELKDSGYSIYTTVFNGVDATTVSYTSPVAIVIGSEGEGVSPLAQKIGTPITLPQRTADISYNASVAAGIMLFLVATGIKKI